MSGDLTRGELGSEADYLMRLDPLGSICTYASLSLPSPSLFTISRWLDLTGPHTILYSTGHLQLDTCLRARPKGIRPCDLQPTRRGLVPYVVPDRPGKPHDGVGPEVRLSTVIATAAGVVRDRSRAVDLSLAAGAEVVDGTGAQVTVDRPVPRVLQGVRR